MVSTNAQTVVIRISSSQFHILSYTPPCLLYIVVVAVVVELVGQEKNI